MQCAIVFNLFLYNFTYILQIHFRIHISMHSYILRFPCYRHLGSWFIIVKCISLYSFPLLFPHDLVVIPYHPYIHSPHIQDQTNQTKKQLFAIVKSFLPDWLPYVFLLYNKCFIDIIWRNINNLDRHNLSIIFLSFLYYTTFILLATNMYRCIGEHDLFLSAHHMEFPVTYIPISC